MYKLNLEKAGEPEIKLPTSIRSSKKQESFRKTSTSALLTTPKPLTVWITTNWKILKEMGIPDHLTCLLRNLYADQEATARTGHGTMVSSHGWESTGAASWPSTLTKCSHPWWGLWSCLLNFYAEYIMWNAGLDETQDGIKTTGRGIPLTFSG